jgi:hypothetical protein
MSAWAVVIRGDWYLPHFANMLKQYTGNSEQVECRDEVVAQIEAQIVRDGPSGVFKTARPLVVIDPEDAEVVNQLADALTQILTEHDVYEPFRSAMQAALREFANPKPPKPEEPTDRSVRVNADGAEWAKVGAWWVSADIGQVPREWDWLVERDDFEVTR